MGERLGRYWRGLAFAVCLSGCSSIGNYNSPDRASPTPPPTMGTVVFSTGAASQCGLGPATELHVEDSSGHIVATAWVDNFVIKSDFSDHQGSVSVLTLPAGFYRVYPFLVLAKPIQTPYGYFNVTAGKSLYIGEYYMTVQCQYVTVGGFRDQEERDLDFVRQKNAGFAQVIFEKRLVKFGGVVKNGLLP